MADFDWNRYTPLDNSGLDFDSFRSAFKNIRFSIRKFRVIRLTEADAANLPGLAYNYYEDTSLWRVLMAYNGITDPIEEVYAGMEFKLPLKADIIAYLDTQSAVTPTYMI